MKTVNKYLGLFGSLCLSAAMAASDAPELTGNAGPVCLAQQREMSFSKSDVNEDEYISRDEFAIANHLSASAPASDTDIRAIRIMDAFQDMDSDADDSVSPDEYIRYLEKKAVDKPFPVSFWSLSSRHAVAMPRAFLPVWPRVRRTQRNHGRPLLA